MYLHIITEILRYTVDNPSQNSSEFRTIITWFISKPEAVINECKKWEIAFILKVNPWSRFIGIPIERPIGLN